MDTTLVNRLIYEPQVFCQPEGGRRIHHWADVAIKKIAKRAGLRKLSWHVLRHTFASHLAIVLFRRFTAPKRPREKRWR